MPLPKSANPIRDLPSENLRQIFSISGGHFIHDTFTAFVAPLLPLIIEKMSLSLALAGGLTAFMQFPAIINPFIGFYADKISLRYFVIFAPATTATLIGLLGFTPNYASLAFLLFLVGISSATFHAPSPAMVANSAKNRAGFGMSLFMAAGELGRTFGPIIAVSAVSTWALNGIYRLIIIGWATSIILLWQFKKNDEPIGNRNKIKTSFQISQGIAFFIPLFFIVLPRSFLIVSITTYLPTYLHAEGASLALAGFSLSILEGAGVLGALSSGTISDRIGRKKALFIALILSPIIALIFIQSNGWASIPILILLGFISLSPQPVLLALVQDHNPNYRAAANGLYLSISFMVRSAVLVLIGLAGDRWGLRITFLGSAIISLLALPAVLALPDQKNTAKIDASLEV